MNFKNEEKFYTWLKNILKTPEFEETAYLEDVAAQYAATGMEIYEVRGAYTKSGRPEEYRFDIINETIVF